MSRDLHRLPPDQSIASIRHSDASSMHGTTKERPRSPSQPRQSLSAIGHTALRLETRHHTNIVVAGCGVADVREKLAYVATDIPYVSVSGQHLLQFALSVLLGMESVSTSASLARCGMMSSAISQMATIPTGRLYKSLDCVWIALSQRCTQSCTLEKRTYYVVGRW